MGKQFLTIKEAAIVLNVNEALVYALVKEDKLSAYRIGSNIRISLNDLKAITKQNKLEPLYPVNQASGVLNLSRITLYNLIKKNKIEVIRIGKIIRLASIFGFGLNQQFLSIKELSQLFRVNPRTVRCLILSKKNKSIKLGAQYRIPESIYLDLTKESAIRPLLAVNEAAKMIGKSRLTILKYIHQGQLAAIKVGRVYRLSEEAVNNYQARIRGTYTISDLAELLRVSPSLIRKLVKRQDIQTIKINGQHRIGKESLDQFLTSNRLDGSKPKEKRLIK